MTADPRFSRCSCGEWTWHAKAERVLGCVIECRHHGAPAGSLA